MPTLTLNQIPGFADLPDNALTQDTPALGIYLNRISNNAAFGMVRLEVFFGLYKNGETVGLPVSTVDDYQYSQSELTYVWSIASSVNPSSGWITGPDSLWWCAWLVNQATGLVSCIEAYRKSGSHPSPATSNDGTLGVFTIAQRLKTTMVIATPLTAYTDLADAGFATDKPLTQSLLRQLNNNAKFSAVNGECIYMGEFKAGDTVPTPISPADGYNYTYAETFFQFSWRWTAEGSTPFQQPDLAIGQLDRIGAGVSSVGVVTTDIQYKNGTAPVQQATHGRISVFAFCSRSNLINTIPSLSNAFAEIDSETFMPGGTLRASTLLQLNKNIREAVCSPEFFGPTIYHNSDLIPLPTSPLDGYAYSRGEMFYVWDWAHTTPQSTGQHYRLPAFLASVINGLVFIKVYRLPPGGPYVIEPSGDSDNAIRVLVVAVRGGSHPVFTAPTTTAPIGTTTTVVVDNGPADIQPYAIPFDLGAGYKPLTSQSLLKHLISDNLLSVTWATGLPTSKFMARVASTGTYVITIKMAGATVGTITYSAGNLTAALSFSAPITSNPFDEVEFIGQATPDATLSGIYGTLSGTRL